MLSTTYPKYSNIVFGCFSVVQLSHLVNESETILARSIPLSSASHAIALSCDHKLLAVNFVQNGISFVTIFSVPSFMSAVSIYLTVVIMYGENVCFTFGNLNITSWNFQTIIPVYSNVLLTSDNNVLATELLWNPVMPNTLAICLDNGALIMMNFTGQSYELYTIDKTEQVK